MPNTTLRRPALNIPLLALWVVAVGVLAFGFWMLQAGNAAQAEFYTSGGSDYLQYLNLQTQSTIGGFLLIAGVIGVLLALATHARNQAAALLAARTAATDEASVEASDDLDDEITDSSEADASTEPETTATEASATTPEPETSPETATTPETEPTRA